AVGGVWTYCLHLAGALARLGVAVDLAVMGPPPDPAQCATAARIPRLTLWIASFRLEWMEGGVADIVRSGQWLLALAARTAPDVVHLNGYAHGALPFPAPKIVVAHSCVLSWWQAVHGCAPPAAWRPYADAVRDGLAGADRVIAPSAEMLRALDAHYGPRAAPSSVIPNGLPPLRGRRPRKRPVVLAAGRLWDAGKNIAALAAAAPAVPWPVTVAGDVSIDATSTESPANGVRYLGRLDAAEMTTAYRRAAIYALPARYEPFGLSVLEAAQHGCALVLGDIASLRENWTGAALFVHPDDVEGLGRTIAALISDRRSQRALARRARRRARKFSLRKMCRATLELYERTAGQDRPRSPRPLAQASTLEGTNQCAL
ncbi:MAG TPA: glycosyltransferase family 4 protein, partial [Polyangia bacterium]|nr:glycosyltransferase family 4 protein [Polyangia bacterium]